MAEYWRQMSQSVPDGTYESVHAYEVGDTAIDEGVFSGRNTGPIQLPDGRTLPPAQKEISIRGVDFATVDDSGQIVDYRPTTGSTSTRWSSWAGWDCCPTRPAEPPLSPVGGRLSAASRGIHAYDHVE
ncbi:nuclear transport factor 2 family protein [Streptomyces sp. NPDC098781]|uniref:nuclear transport factor 2 family protein n=1 Tax=Streptomyces sp. NPDC098781 TaxID=3366097 RepID=UPI003823A89F